MQYTYLHPHIIDIVIMTSLRSKLFKLNEDNILKIAYNKSIPLSMNILYPNEKQKRLHYDTLLKYNGVVNFHSREWSLNLFNNNVMPLIIGTVGNNFNKRNNNGKYLWVMDLPIKMPRTNIRIPYELNQFKEFILKSFTHEVLTNPHVNDWFAYLCVDQRPVMPNFSQRRPGAHSDSFPMGNTQMTRISDSIYLGYNNMPTEFCIGDFTFNNNIDMTNIQEILKHFDIKTTSVKTFDPYHIIKMDSGHVHRVSFNNTNNVIDRTFIKLTFSPDIFNRVGNDHNYLFDYDWPLYERSIERNNSSIFGGHMNDDEYSFYGYDDCIKLFHNNKNVTRMKRKGKVYVVPANEGDLLATRCLKSNRNFMSCSVAKKNSWKVINPITMVEYFLDNNKLVEFYDTTNISCGKLLDPKPNTHILAVKINENIRINTPWGGFQYLSNGDYLIKRHNGDIYGITVDDMQNNYDHS